VHKSQNPESRGLLYFKNGANQSSWKLPPEMEELETIKSKLRRCVENGGHFHKLVNGFQFYCHFSSRR